MLKAIIGGTVIDGTGASPIHDAVLLISGDRVQSLSRAADTVVPPEAEVIDVSGRYVIPGLIDANAHLSTWMPDTLLRHEGNYARLVEEATQVTLRSGLTTLFDTHGHLESLADVRDRIGQGDAVGSRIFIAGNIIGLDGPFSADYFTSGSMLGPDTLKRINSQFENDVGSDLLRLTAEGVRRRVRDYIERSDIDLVKYASSGHRRQRHLIAFSEPAQRAIVEEAHRAGLTVQAHSTTVESLRMAIEAGARLLLATDGFAMGPQVLNHPLMAGLLKCAPPVYVLGESHFVWLEAVIERGMKPMEALLSATRNTAEAYGKADDLGTLEAGKRADLLILEADPLADVSNYRRIVEVMKDGVLVDRDALPTRRILSGTP